MVMHLELMPPSETAIALALLVNIGKAVSDRHSHIFPFRILHVHLHGSRGLGRPDVGFKLSCGSKARLVEVLDLNLQHQNLEKEGRNRK